MLINVQLINQVQYNNKYVKQPKKKKKPKN